MSGPPSAAAASPPAPVPASRAGRLRWQPQAWSVLPPAVAYLAARVSFALATGTKAWDFSPDTWSRWDTGNYVDIATRGYYWASCVSQNRPNHGDLCSPAAWYPGYPFLGRALSSVLGIDVHTAFVVISHTAFVALLAVVWIRLLHARRDPRSLSILAVAAFFPGNVYLLAEFPVSLLVLLLALQVDGYLRGRWWWGSAFGAAAGFVYPITVVLPVASALWAIVVRTDLERARRLGFGAAVGAVTALGTVAVFVLHQVVLGDWAASIEEQKRFGGTLYNPLLNWGHVVVKRNSWIQLTTPSTATAIAAQTLLVTVFVLGCGALVWFVPRHRTRHDVGLLALIVPLWLLPLSSTIETGLYRRVVPLLVGVWLLRRAPWPAIAAFAAAAFAVNWWLAPLFFAGDLV